MQRSMQDRTHLALWGMRERSPVELHPRQGEPSRSHVMGWWRFEGDTAWALLMEGATRPVDPDIARMDARWLEYESPTGMLSRRQLMARWGWTERQVRTFLRHETWKDPLATRCPKGVPRGSQHRPSTVPRQTEQTSEHTQEGPSTVPVPSQGGPSTVHTRVDPPTLPLPPQEEAQTSPSATGVSLFTRPHPSPGAHQGPDAEPATAAGPDRADPPVVANGSEVPDGGRGAAEDGGPPDAAPEARQPADPPVRRNGSPLPQPVVDAYQAVRASMGMPERKLTSKQREILRLLTKKHGAESVIKVLDWWAHDTDDQIAGSAPFHRQRRSDLTTMRRHFDAWLDRAESAGSKPPPPGRKRGRHPVVTRSEQDDAAAMAALAKLAMPVDADAMEGR